MNAELSEILTDLYAVKSALGAASGRLARVRALTHGVRVAIAAEMVATGVKELSEAACCHELPVLLHVEGTRL